MKETMLFSSKYVFFIFIVSFKHFVHNSEGFSINLTHHFSSESPFYEPNITSFEMIRRFNLQLQSKDDEKLSKTIFSTDTLRNMKVIQPKLEYARGGGYLAMLNLGTFPNEQPSYKTYYFHFDTGSYLTWLQCEECTKDIGKCFHQNGSPYPNRMSTTYAPLPCKKHQLCFLNQCHNQHCSYNISYVDSTHSFGVLAYETFTFGVMDTGRTLTARTVIGCGIRNNMKLLGDKMNEAGILGMGWGPYSFVNQIHKYSHGRYSYCLPPVVSKAFRRHSTVLRFGNDIPFYHGLRSLPIRHYDRSYGVNLRGLSINRKRLNIPRQYFGDIVWNHGGCMFDTGTTYSFIPHKAFNVLKEEVIQYVTGVDKGLEIMREGMLEFGLCFVRCPPLAVYNALPTITYHFEGGVDLVQESDIAFVVFSKKDRKYVCMGILPSYEDNVAVLGSQSQANHMFVFDQVASRVYFGPRDCTRNP